MVFKCYLYNYSFIVIINHNTIINLIQTFITLSYKTVLQLIYHYNVITKFISYNESEANKMV